MWDKNLQRVLSDVNVKSLGTIRPLEEISSNWDHLLMGNLDANYVIQHIGSHADIEGSNILIGDSDSDGHLEYLVDTDGDGNFDSVTEDLGSFFDEF